MAHPTHTTHHMPHATCHMPPYTLFVEYFCRIPIVGVSQLTLMQFKCWNHGRSNLFVRLPPKMCSNASRAVVVAVVLGRLLCKPFWSPPIHVHTCPMFMPLGSPPSPGPVEKRRNQQAAHSRGCLLPPASCHFLFLFFVFCFCDKA